MVSNSTVEHRVMQRAETAFLEREVFKTGKRIGILLFISALERKVVILADSGISKLVPNEEWQLIVDNLIEQDIISSAIGFSRCLTPLSHPSRACLLGSRGGTSHKDGRRPG